MKTCTCNFSHYSVLVDDMPDDTNPHGGSCPFAPKVQQIIAAVDAAVPYSVGFHNTGGGCHAIRIEVGDYQHDDFREVMITDVDVFIASDYDSDDNLGGEFWIGAYDGSGDPIGEESLIVVPDDGDFTDVVLPKIVEQMRVQLALVEQQPKPTPDREIDGTPEHAAAHGEPDDEPDAGESPRTYVIGLPVIATVSGDGFVTVEVDTSELGSSKVLGELGANFDYPDHVIDADAETLKRWAQQHVVQNAGYAR